MTPAELEKYFSGHTLRWTPEDYKRIKILLKIAKISYEICYGIIPANAVSVDQVIVDHIRALEKIFHETQT